VVVTVTVLTIEYECGYAVEVPLHLDDSQSTLHQPSLVDTFIGLADAQHDRECGQHDVEA
jgi:hypothetical protein